MEEQVEKNTHWVAIAGLLGGYLPNWCEAFKLKEDAIEGAVDLHECEYGKPRIEEVLREDGYAEIDMKKFGNEYVEIVECACEQPWTHSETDEEENWKNE